MTAGLAMMTSPGPSSALRSSLAFERPEVMDEIAQLLELQPPVDTVRVDCDGVQPETGRTCMLGLHKGFHAAEDGSRWLDD
jgi:hypothetical protein